MEERETDSGALARFRETLARARTCVSGLEEAVTASVRYDALGQMEVGSLRETLETEAEALRSLAGLAVLAAAEAAPPAPPPAPGTPEPRGIARLLPRRSMAAGGAEREEEHQPQADAAGEVRDAAGFALDVMKSRRESLARAAFAAKEQAVALAGDATEPARRRLYRIEEAASLLVAQEEAVMLAARELERAVPRPKLLAAPFS